MGEEATLNELMKQRDELTRERDGQVREAAGHGCNLQQGGVYEHVICR
jgi:hypothetical protein